jgi:hypothetical protein
MALKEYKNLTQDEVYRADLMALRISLAVILHHLIDEAPEPQKITDRLASAVAQIVDQLKLEAIPPIRQQAFRDVVAERGAALMRQALEIRHENRRRRALSKPRPISNPSALLSSSS